MSHECTVDDARLPPRYPIGLGVAARRVWLSADVFVGSENTLARGGRRRSNDMSDSGFVAARCAGID